MGELVQVRLVHPAEQQQRIDVLERQVAEQQAVIAALRAELEQRTRPSQVMVSTGGQSG